MLAGSGTGAELFFREFRSDLSSKRNTRLRTQGARDAVQLH
jgi:hypothetical protein